MAAATVEEGGASDARSAGGLALSRDIDTCAAEWGVSVDEAAAARAQVSMLHAELSSDDDIGMLSFLYAKRVMDGEPAEDRCFQFNRLITAPNLKWANARERHRAVLKRNGDTTSVTPPAGVQTLDAFLGAYGVFVDAWKTVWVGGVRLVQRVQKSSL